MNMDQFGPDPTRSKQVWSNTSDPNLT